jgi:hypothetical protein
MNLFNFFPIRFPYITKFYTNIFSGSRQTDVQTTTSIGVLLEPVYKGN